MEDYRHFDRIYYMDASNARWLARMLPKDPEKIRPLLNRDVADPWYTGDFEQTAETGYVFCPCKPDVIFEDAALRYSNKQHKISIFLISITPQAFLRYNKSIYRRKR